MSSTTLHLSAVLLEHKQVVGTEEGDARRQREPVDHRAKLEVRSEQRRAGLRLANRPFSRRAARQQGKQHSESERSERTPTVYTGPGSG